MPYITLTSHNAPSHDLNAQRLESLPERSRTFKAKIVGDFPETSYPTEETLEFKKGAQVMFVRNDLSPEKRYFNGKIRKTTRLAGDEIFVRCNDEREDFAVTPPLWRPLRIGNTVQMSVWSSRVRAPLKPPLVEKRYRSEQEYHSH
jgi:hypothetical protein